jgi:hypothetical protein
MTRNVVLCNDCQLSCLVEELRFKSYIGGILFYFNCIGLRREKRKEKRKVKPKENRRKKLHMRIYRRKENRRKKPRKEKTEEKTAGAYVSKLTEGKLKRKKTQVKLIEGKPKQKNRG